MPQILRKIKFIIFEAERESERESTHHTRVHRTNKIHNAMRHPPHTAYGPFLTLCGWVVPHCFSLVLRRAQAKFIVCGEGFFFYFYCVEVLCLFERVHRIPRARGCSKCVFVLFSSFPLAMVFAHTHTHTHQTISALHNYP